MTAFCTVASYAAKNMYLCIYDCTSVVAPIGSQSLSSLKVKSKFGFLIKFTAAIDKFEVTVEFVACHGGFDSQLKSFLMTQWRSNDQITSLTESEL